MRLRGDYGSRATLPLNLFFPLHVFAEGPQSFAPVIDVYQSWPQCAIGERWARTSFSCCIAEAGSPGSRGGCFDLFIRRVIQSKPGTESIRGAGRKPIQNNTACVERGGMPSMSTSKRTEDYGAESFTGA